ncbi:MAG: HIT family protein [Sphingobium phenoxybenzoativorans]
MTVQIEGCAFCAIAVGQAPARMVFETDDVLCFFPRRPNLFGHTLIVSRSHHSDLRNAPAGLGTHVFAAAQALSALYREKLNAGAFNLMIANGLEAEQSVSHLHFHYMPRFAQDDFSTWPDLPPFETDLDALLAQIRE